MSDASALQTLLQSYRDASKTEREKGTYFEELMRTYLKYEPAYAALYSDVWLLSEVPEELGISKQDAGIDLVARTQSAGELHAIQCKFYDSDHRIQKADIDSFFTASGQKPFIHRVIVTTTNNWGDKATAALFNQQPPISTIDLHDLENSQIDWSKYKPKKKPALKPKFDPRPHQKSAISSVVSGLKTKDRGKLIMACGTGKTFTSLKIAEKLAGKGKRVLFLVPSLALLSQSLTEWTQQSKIPLHSFAVCSDAQVGKKRKKDDDIVQTFVHELRYPATTDAKKLASEIKQRHDDQHMSVVFSTYHSIERVSEAQKKHKLDEFDLIICDEAHRTTGATYADEEDSAFVRVHDQKFLKADKRLYMTATPRIYANIAKAKAIQDDIALCSMDDPEIYGDQLHVITFSEAVELGLLTDYKVVVLTIDEDHVSQRLQNLLKDDNNQLKVDDAARIIGCWKALSKQGLAEELKGDTSPMQKAVAFCQVIEPSTGKKTHKVSSKQISEMFQTVIDEYRDDSGDDSSTLTCESRHVDGSMNATEKESKINWLKEDAGPDVCRVLSNVRCLSEGVDVPALDAVLFLSPRSSPVEVVQSVGRVMRRSPGKKLGYVVLPVVIPHGMEPAAALNDNKVYKVVWDVLQALRSHDDRFDAMINKLDLVGDSSGKMEVIAVTDTLSPKSKGKSKKETGKGAHAIGEADDGPRAIQRNLQFEVGELEKALYARLVKKCGNRSYWEEWANDIAAIAQTHISRIAAIVKEPEAEKEKPKNKKERAAFKAFADEIRDDLNDAISDEEVIEMLAQHLITKPVFDALFAEYSFASNNPVSKGMQRILDLLQEHRLDKEANTLEQFYASVRRRADGIDKAEGKQKIVVELYDKFFRNAFPKMTERLGIVYTPTEVVDFIIHSVNDILQEEFGQTLGSEGVHILDPFTGTGTFITRLMQSGLITPEQLPHKYKHEIHCNEIVLLAYYISAINIEAVYHSIMSEKAQDVGGEAPAYVPFDGICLTDTFQMYESDDLIEQFFPDNSERRKRQKKLDIRVIVGNPPYSAGQTDANDDNPNVEYKKLDDRIRSTYAKHSSATNKNALYDSYIRAIRWASDRVGSCGVVGFVTNAGFLDSTTADGLRKCLAEEFDSLYIFHLRGNQRTAGERSRREGGKIFGSGSRAPISINILVKREESKKSNAEILWHDIGDYLTREQKLEIVAGFSSTSGITKENRWVTITPDQHFDWVNQGDSTFEQHTPIGDKKDVSAGIFSSYSAGLKTNRDAWCYNFSRSQLENQMQAMIGVYDDNLSTFESVSKDNDEAAVDDVMTLNPKLISWNRGLKNDLRRLKPLKYKPDQVVVGAYRPFQKQWCYFDKDFNDMVYRLPGLFPTSKTENLTIAVSGVGHRGTFSVLITRHLPSINFADRDNNQCFSLDLYEASGGQDLFSESGSNSSVAIPDSKLDFFRSCYGGESITKEDLFYYIYGLLHSPEYRERYKDNLSKELPRIPAVKKFEDFQAFSQAGRDLAHWHLDYETVDCHEATIDVTDSRLELENYNVVVFSKGVSELRNKLKLNDEHFYVRKMKFTKTTDPNTNKRVNDKASIIYNEHITVRGIPLEAYDYVVNGKSAIEWVMERQSVKEDKKSGIVNDANLWATETMGDAAYPLELLLRVITVSLETMKIVNGLPNLDID